MFNSIEKLREALEGALILERAACVVYLTATYAFKGTKNKPLKKLIKSVSLEEMGHVIAASNLLNAIGGTPRFSDVKLSFPTKLPLGISPPEIVDLGSPSEELLRLGLHIEMPEYMQPHQIAFDHQLEKFTLESLKEHLKKTRKEKLHRTSMGQFFKNLKEGFIYLNKTKPKELWVGDKAKQVTIRFSKFKEIEAVVDIESALRTIESVMHESEGLPMKAMHGDWISHYFKFSQVLKGQKLVFDQKTKEYQWKDAEGMKLDMENIIPLRKFESVDELNEEEKKVWEGYAGEYIDMMKLLDDLFGGKLEFSEPKDPKEIMDSMKRLDKWGKKLGALGICPRYDV